MIRVWLCRHEVHHWTANRMGGTARWCDWGGHWETGDLFSAIGEHDRIAP